jgi:L-asparaginase II
VVSEILTRLGLDETALCCGVHWPSDEAERTRLQRAGEKPSALHNNCSGKHAGMLATARALGASIEGYLQLDHPVQALIRGNLALLAGISETDLQPLVDGCGAPTYAMALRGVASVFAQLAAPTSLPPELAEAVVRVREAMSTHPEMVAGAGAFNTELLRAGRGALIAKGGSEGLFAVGLRDSGLGVALKVTDGSNRPWPPAIVTLLSRQRGVDHAALQQYVRPVTRNWLGVEVGHLEATAELTELVPV